MLYGYMRVSKSDGSQVLDMQEDALIQAGVLPENIYQDMMSGKNWDREGLNSCLNTLTAGDKLVTYKLDRIGRSLRDLLNTIDYLTEKKVGLKILSGMGGELDTTTSHGKLLFTILAGFAEFEADLISERTKEGLKAARKRGRIGGRPTHLSEAEKAKARQYFINTGDADATMKLFGIPKSTFYKSYYPLLPLPTCPEHPHV